MSYLLYIYNIEKFNKLKSDLSDPIFLFLLCIVSFLSWKLLNYKSDIKIRIATKRAMLALIIAYLAHLDLIFSAFFVVWIFEYYMDID